MSFDGLLGYIATVPQNAFGMFGALGHFLGPIALAVALLVAIVHVVRRWRGRQRRPSPRRLLRLVFPRQIFLHRSALNDWGMMFINQGVLFLRLAQPC